MNNKVEFLNWEEVEKKTGVKVKLQDGSFRPVNEWLDDLYINFTYEQASVIFMAILQSGGALFSDILTHQE